MTLAFIGCLSTATRGPSQQRQGHYWNDYCDCSELISKGCEAMSNSHSQHGGSQFNGCALVLTSFIYSGLSGCKIGVLKASCVPGTSHFADALVSSVRDVPCLHRALRSATINWID